MTARTKNEALLIAIEGIDGAGTTTQAHQLHRWLLGQGIAAHLTCEPSAGTVGPLIRRALGGELPVDRACLALLFAADRVDHFQTEIAPRRSRGEWVVTDRYVHSSLAYQSLDLPLSWVASINCRVPDADLTFYLRVDPDRALDRVAVRDQGREIFETLEQQKRIAARYDYLFGVQAAGPDQAPRSERNGHDPCGSGAIRADPDGSPKIRADPAGRSPNVRIIDGNCEPDAVSHELKNEVEKFALQRGIWDVR